MSVQSRIVSSLIGVVAVSLGVANAHAADVADAGVLVVNRTVKYADLDLSKQKDASALYSRLKMASQRVCASGASAQNLRMRSIGQSCADAALTDAVRKVDHPAVAALHDSSRPTRIARSARGDGQRT